MIRTYIPWAAGAALLLATAACSGSSSSPGATNAGAVNGLDLPSAVSVVTANGTSGGGATIGPGASAGGPATGGESFDTDSDYHTDEAFYYVWDSAMEPLDLINEILCMMSQTQAGQMVNYGAYLAQIDGALCGVGSDAGDDTGESTGTELQFEIWTVKSTREDNDSPQIVKVWVPDDEMGLTIHVRTVVSAAPDDLNPFGSFAMDFAGVPEGGSESQPMFYGSLETVEAAEGSIGFVFFQAFGDVEAEQDLGGFADLIQVAVNMSSDQSTGVAKVYRKARYDWGMNGGTDTIEEETNLIAFDENYMLKQVDDGSGVYWSRSNFLVNTWNYNLYYNEGDNAGQRVDIESGFPFVTEDGSWGWIDYWGIWVDGGATLQSGDIITRETYDGTAGQQYEVFAAPGRLIRFETNELALTDIVGMVFTWWDSADDGNGGFTWAQYQVQYDGSDWLKTAVLDEETWTWTPLDPPETIDVANMGWLDMWSDNLGGMVSYVYPDDAVTYFAEEFVDGSDTVFANSSTLTLYGFVDCLKSGITEEEGLAGDVFLPEAADVNSPYVFIFDSTDMTLYHDVDGDGSNLTQVGLADGVTLNEGMFSWGMRSGPMVTDTSGLTEIWDVWAATTFYQYETGSNPWNQYVGVLDANDEFVTFEQPINFTYTHSTDNDANGDNSHDGEIVFMSYNGPGQLWGIPWEGTDFDEDGFEDRWFPTFSIRDGVTMGPTGSEYIVRAIESELLLLEDPNGTGLSLEGAQLLELPDPSIYSEPGIGSEPVVDDPPAVIAGEVVVDLGASTAN